MFYLTDNPWPAIIVLVGLATCAFVVGHPTLRKLGLVFGMAAGLVYLTSEMMTSNRERVEIAAKEILDGFKAEDLTTIGTRISQQSPNLIEIARRGLDLVKIESDFHIQAVHLKSESDREIVVQIRANGNITERSQLMTQRAAELWETTWTRESNAWQLSKAVRLNPLTRKPRGTFDPS